MDRRGFLGCLAGAAAPVARAETAGFVASDVGALKRVLVHAPGPETRKGLGLSYGPLRFLGGTIDERATEEHLAMVELLRAGGAEVLTMEGVLKEAVRESRRAGALRAWLRGWAPQLAPEHERVTAAVLLGAADEFIYRHDAEGRFAPLADPAGSLYWTRDAAVMTPRGVMLGHFSNPARANEAVLMRFAYEWAPALKKYPIVFDAAEEEVALEGGDVFVADARTLWMGVGNRTDETAARRAARKLNMDVLAVSLPPRGRPPLNGLFLHLDTVCCLVDRKTVLTLPYLFEQEWAGRDPFTEMVRGLAANPKAKEANLGEMPAVLEKLGRVTLYRAGSGEAADSVKNMKLVDWLKREGYEVIYIGGPLPMAGREKHMTEHVLRELRRQAGNVVAVAPRKVVAYAGNPGTQRALEEAGIQVLAFAGNEVRRNNGGPHCLTQPLERG